MSKIENIQSITEVRQKHLDIHQFQIIKMYEDVAMEENIYRYLFLLNRNGYSFWFEYKNGTAYFKGCDPQYIGFNGNSNIHEQYEWNLIHYVKMMLTDWHTSKQYSTMPRRFRAADYLCTCKHDPAGIQLTKKQRGILTKILKIENKRKRLLKS